MKLHRLASSFAALAACFAALALSAQNSTPASTSAASAQQPQAAGEHKKIEIPGVNLTHGPATVKLGSVAELKLPEGCSFVGPDSLDKFFELTENMRGGKEVGVVLSRNGWMLYFDFDDIGYVKDDDKADLNASKLYARLTEGMTEGNKTRRERGWSELKLQGWEREPYYDEKTHNLKWAFKLSSSHDQYQSVSVNQNIRLLGRGGVMEVTLAGRLDRFSANEAEANALLANFQYLPGAKYSEFKAGDKVAKYGLAALVVGGAGFAAAKVGLLGKLGALFAKAGKLIVVGVVALGAAIAKVWKKIIGRDKVE